MGGGYARLEQLSPSLDRSGMIDLVKSFPLHMEDAWDRGYEFTGSIETYHPAKIVICGMGGSAIGGDMVRSCLGDRLEVPLHVNRGYDVAASLRGDAFFVFSSYSGNTGETLSAYEAVRGSGIRAAAITSGGKLERRCREDGVPVCSIPGGMPPRAAIAYSFFPLLHTLAALGVARIDESEFDDAKKTLAGLCEDFASDGPANTAAELAYKIEGKLPFVYSCDGLFDAVARRWSCQFNENGKSLAHFSIFTELNHNEIVGWAALESLRENIAVISLKDAEDHPMALRQAEITLDLIESLCGDVIRVESVPGPRMTRILSAMILGDFTSVYLAYLNGVDPTPVENIDFLKERLKKDPSLKQR
ncbi:MAG: bifunctional phosphoglucose/phosphomannose isomerase [Candidatus Latescibacterota bacterium]|nr:MAG: bifunctional phosphoglucose/phosphomannose isomerase [Candidatus Latescibacterota bacterium]